MDMERTGPKTVLAFMTTDRTLGATLVTAAVSESRITTDICLLTNYLEKIVHDVVIAGKEGLDASIAAIVRVALKAME